MTRSRGGSINSEKLIGWFDFQAPLYHFWRDDYDAPVVAAVLARVRAEPAHRLLDAACGTGLFTIGLTRAEPQLTIDGIDASAGMLGVAKQQAAQKGLDSLRFQQGDVLSLPFRDRSFEVVIAAGLVPCLNEPGLALAEFHRVLDDRGRLISVEIDREAMSFLFRLFFKTMIAGYHMVTRVFRRFRFAERWNITRSTIDPVAYEGELEAHGFDLIEATSVAGHRLYHMRKGHREPGGSDDR